MRKAIVALLLLLLLSSCATVLRKDLMERGIRDFSFTNLVKDPETYKGKLFILGGLIADTRLTERESLIEALYAPVDRGGFVGDITSPPQRFLAFYPKEAGILDPMIYKSNKQVTLAGTFTGTQTGMIDKMEYLFPTFQIQEIYLWEERPRIQYVPYPWGPFYPYPGPAWPYLGGPFYPYFW
jgi:outer membrane lipoprotein